MPKKPIRTQKKLLAENEDLRARLDEAEEILRAIRSGEVDALIVSGVGGEQILTFKQVEEALRSSEEKYRTLVDEVNDGFYVSDEAGIFTFANPAMAGIYGVETPQALVGRQFLDFVVPEMLAELGETHRRMMQAGHSPEVINGQIVRPDGTRAFIEVKSASIVKGNQIVGSRGVVRDVTERKRIEEELKKSEGKFRAIFDNASTGMFIVDLKAQKFFMCNSTCAKMLGYAQEKFLNLDIADIHPGEDMPFINEQILKFSRGEEGIRSDIKFKRKNGSIFASDLSPALLTIADKEYLLISFIDITERKKAEEKIQQQLEHLTALSAIERIIASIFDLKLSLSEILTHVTKELGIDAADILILNSNSHTLEYGAEHGFRTEAIRKAQVRLGENYAGRVALERYLVQITNLREEPKNPSLKTFIMDEDFVCYFGVPLIFKGQLNGVLEVFHRAALEPDTEWFNFLNALAGQAAIAIENSTLFENLQRSSSELSLAYDATIEGWSHALDLRDKETEGHTQRVSEMTVTLARSFGMSEVELAQVRWGALLHDIGKMGVPDGILLKPGPLTDEEWVVMKKHPTFAYEMLTPIRYLRLALDIPYCHHEKWDGSGYPRGLKGEQIPLVARIFAVVDVWDALISDRPYRLAWPEEKARKLIKTGAGTHFDPQVVEVFMKMPK